MALRFSSSSCRPSDLSASSNPLFIAPCFLFDPFSLSKALWDGFAQRAFCLLGLPSGLSPEEAREISEDYFSSNGIIGDIKENEWFFAGEIRDKNNNLIDKAANNKRTGRIRSML